MLVRRVGFLAWLAAFPPAAAFALLAAPARSRRAAQVSPPPLAAGQSLLYRLQYRSQIQTSSAGPIYNPEAAHNLLSSLTAKLRLDVLSVTRDAHAGPFTRLRATCVSADAIVQSDAYDPGADALQETYAGLKGSSFDFTVDASGRILQLAGLDAKSPDQNVETAIRQWFGAITLPVGLWRPGMKPGRKWGGEVPLVGAPLDGLVWRTRSLYRDDEPCPPSPGAPPSQSRQSCAVIVTTLDSRRQAAGRDPTPPDYRRHGLHTSGKWTASGDSLGYVSLSTGLVISSTSTESDDIDVTIASDSGSHLRYFGKVTSASQVSLLSAIPSSAPK